MKISHKKQPHEKRDRRHRRIRSRIQGTSERPRLSVFKSNRYLYAQLIDDHKGTTIAASSTKDLKGKSMMEKATALGKALAQLAQKHKVSHVVFDRGGYLYAGRVKAVAEGAREGGLKF